MSKACFHRVFSASLFSASCADIMTTVSKGSDAGRDSNVSMAAVPGQESVPQRYFLTVFLVRSRSQCGVAVIAQYRCDFV